MCALSHSRAQSHVIETLINLPSLAIANLANSVDVVCTTLIAAV